jgi:hypothetical protein
VRLRAMGDSAFSIYTEGVPASDRPEDSGQQ